MPISTPSLLLTLNLILTLSLNPTPTLTLTLNLTLILSDYRTLFEFGPENGKIALRFSLWTTEKSPFCVHKSVPKIKKKFIAK